jgi:hypothetical protein
MNNIIFKYFAVEDEILFCIQCVIVKLSEPRQIFIFETWVYFDFIYILSEDLEIIRVTNNFWTHNCSNDVKDNFFLHKCDHLRLTQLSHASFNKISREIGSDLNHSRVRVKHFGRQLQDLRIFIAHWTAFSVNADDPVEEFIQPTHFCKLKFLFDFFFWNLIQK